MTAYINQCFFQNTYHILILLSINLLLTRTSHIRSSFSYFTSPTYPHMISHWSSWVYFRLRTISSWLGIYGSLDQFTSPSPLTIDFSIRQVIFPFSTSALFHLLHLPVLFLLVSLISNTSTHHIVHLNSFFTVLNLHALSLVLQTLCHPSPILKSINLLAIPPTSFSFPTNHFQSTWTTKIRSTWLSLKPITRLHASRTSFCGENLRRASEQLPFEDFKTGSDEVSRH